jgi:hypothetical protein
VLTATAGTGARGFYERAGFSVFGIEPAAVAVAGSCHDKLHMILFLPAPGAGRPIPPKERP